MKEAEKKLLSEEYRKHRASKAEKIDPEIVGPYNVFKVQRFQLQQ